MLKKKPGGEGGEGEGAEGRSEGGEGKRDYDTQGGGESV